MTDAVICQDVACDTVPIRGGRLGSITLTRPTAMNALTLDMCQAILSALRTWEADRSVKAIVVRGVGDRAFCAGGDIKWLYEVGQKNPEEAATFFRCEYLMNKAIYHLSKPYVSFLHGVTMGGGVGLSAHGSYRVAADDLRWAMPETGIGFFPDVGAGYVLSRCLPPMGLCLALTGYQINASEAVALGLVTHRVTDFSLDTVYEALCDADWKDEAHNVVQDVLSPYAVPADVAHSDLIAHQEMIQSAFSQTTAEGIVSALEALDEDFARQLLKLLLRQCPLSVKVAMSQVHQATHLAFDAVMDMEFDIGRMFLQTDDFFEGVRAAVIDKDRSPKWRYPSLSDVTEEHVASFFDERAGRLDD